MLRRASIELDRAWPQVVLGHPERLLDVPALVVGAEQVRAGRPQGEAIGQACQISLICYSTPRQRRRRARAEARRVRPSGLISRPSRRLRRPGGWHRCQRDRCSCDCRLWRRTGVCRSALTPNSVTSPSPSPPWISEPSARTIRPGPYLSPSPISTASASASSNVSARMSDDSLMWSAQRASSDGVVMMPPEPTSVHGPASITSNLPATAAWPEASEATAGQKRISRSSDS